MVEGHVRANSDSEFLVLHEISDAAEGEGSDTKPALELRWQLNLNVILFGDHRQAHNAPPTEDVVRQQPRFVYQFQPRVEMILSAEIDRGFEEVGVRVSMLLGVAPPDKRARPI